MYNVSTGDFLVCMIYVGLASACPNYSCWQYEYELLRHAELAVGLNAVIYLVAHHAFSLSNKIIYTYKP